MAPQKETAFNATVWLNFCQSAFLCFLWRGNANTVTSTPLLCNDGLKIISASEFTAALLNWRQSWKSCWVSGRHLMEAEGLGDCQMCVAVPSDTAQTKKAEELGAFLSAMLQVPSHSSWLLSEIPPRASPWFIPWQASATSHCQGQEDKKYFCKRRITILFIPGRNLLASPGPPQPDWLRRAAGGRVPAGQSRSVGAPHCRLCPCGAPATAPTAAPPSGRAASGPSRAAGKKRGSPAVSARAAMLPWERRRAPPAANRQGPRGRRSRSVASPRPRCGHEAVGSARLRAARVCGSKPRSA